MGHRTHSQGLAAFKSNMAARFWHNQIPQKNLALLHDLDLPQAEKYSDVICRGE